MSSYFHIHIPYLHQILTNVEAAIDVVEMQPAITQLAITLAPARVDIREMDTHALVIRKGSFQRIFLRKEIYTMKPCLDLWVSMFM